jgi:aspartate carbamoyltransferase catalytic subunit
MTATPASTVAPFSTARHLLGLDGLSRDDILPLLDRAAALAPVARGERARLDSLRHRTVANLFLEDSTRTRCSFTLAARRLGADTLDIGAAGSSASKGETLIDTCLNLQAMGVDAFVIRTSASGAPHQAAAELDAPVINAGDGRHEHPTQGLLDLLTLRERLGDDLAGRRVAIVGDVVNSRVARSAMFGLTALGAHVVFVGPPSLVPATFEQLSNGPGVVSIERDFDAVIPEVDAVMMLRVQFERAAGEHIASIEEFRERFSLTARRASRMKPHAAVLHPGPINRGLEMESAVVDDPARSAILRQVSNGVAVRMAVLEWAIGAA